MALTAIFGGTFNPLHIGHYKMLEALQNNPNISEILIMPDKIPPHKVCDVMAKDSLRIEMCKITAADFSKAKVCLIEFEREGKSYSYDTVINLKSSFPDKEFVFVCGADMLVTFDLWYNYDKLMKELPFIVFKRGDIPQEEFNSALSRFRKMGMEILVDETVIPCVSSTAIRCDIKNSKRLLTDEVYNLLSESGAYLA